jgi:hypothetical protein
MPPDSTRALVCAACGLDVESPDTRRNRALSARRRSSIAADSTRAEHLSTGNPYIIKSIYSETKLPAREDRLEAPLPEIAPGSIDLDDALKRCAQGIGRCCA